MTNKKVFIIAEIGNLHEGSLGLAKKIMEAAADCGVDAIKMQTHIFAAESTPDAPRPSYFREESRESYFKRTSFNLAQYKELKKYCQSLSCQFMSSPFSLEAIDFLEQVGLDIFKVPSGEISNIPYLIRLAKTGKKVLLPVGMSTWVEIDQAVKTLQANGCKDLVIMQCTTEYPCPLEKVGLNVISELKKRYNLPVGLSDHTMNYVAIPVAAVMLGVEVYEKHFTLSRLMYGSDAKTALEPDEFKFMVKEIRQLEKALNSQVDKNKLDKNLRQMKIIFEKSIVAARDLKKGQMIKASDLAYKKPGDGIPAREYRNIIGKKLNKTVKKDYKFTKQDFYV